MTHPHLPVTWSPVHRDPPGPDDLTLTAPAAAPSTSAGTPAGTARTDRPPSGRLAVRTPSPPNGTPPQVTGRSGAVDRRPPSERSPAPSSSPRRTP
ncbi:hypothetical protein ACIQTN_33845 [Streptomyces werraensis]|uniref:hypothetical protein n=1 Tax=Streptomyces werraensis TaxID=68284 RepID=UPI0038245CC9